MSKAKVKDATKFKAIAVNGLSFDNWTWVVNSENISVITPTKLVHTEALHEQTSRMPTNNLGDHDV